MREKEPTRGAKTCYAKRSHSCGKNRDQDPIGRPDSRRSDPGAVTVRQAGRRLKSANSKRLRALLCASGRSDRRPPTAETEPARALCRDSPMFARDVRPGCSRATRLGLEREPVAQLLVTRGELLAFRGPCAHGLLLVRISQAPLEIRIYHSDLINTICT